MADRVETSAEVREATGNVRKDLVSSGVGDEWIGSLVPGDCVRRITEWQQGQRQLHLNLLVFSFGGFFVLLLSPLPSPPPPLSPPSRYCLIYGSFAVVNAMPTSG